MNALQIAEFAPRAELVAVSDPYPEALEWAKANLPSTVKSVDSRVFLQLREADIFSQDVQFL